jgi:hypothetical protein
MISKGFIAGRSAKFRARLFPGETKRYDETSGASPITRR